MSANILLIEYEPRYIDRVKKALGESGYRLEVCSDLDGAVERCAHFEPNLVILTSVLPRLKIEDAITQLRARAGLRTTPFLVLMSGYRGSDPQGDATRYGAQDILERPFAGEVLVQRIERLLQNAPSPATTQAIPQDMLEALRRSAGLTGGAESLTSDQLFGDIVSDVGTSDSPAPRARASREPETGSFGRAVTRSIDSSPTSSRGRSRLRQSARRRSSETDVDMILSQTLAGLDIQPARKPKPAAPPAEPSARVEQPAPPPASPPPPAKAAPPPAKPEPPAAKEPRTTGQRGHAVRSVRAAWSTSPPAEWPRSTRPG